MTEFGKKYMAFKYFNILETLLEICDKYDVLFIPENFREHRLKVTLSSFEKHHQH